MLIYILKKSQKLFFLSLFLNVHSSSFSQSKPENKWINLQQIYYKFTIEKTGVYRIGYEAIKNYKEVLANPSNIQVYNKGLEIPTRKIGLEDGSFDKNDYIELFLQANGGEQDSTAYRPANARPTVNSNLFSEQTTVFITVGVSEGQKMPIIKYKETTYIPEQNHIAIDTYDFKDEWSFNNSIGLVPYLQNSYYERGESWTGKFILRDSLARKRIVLQNLVENASDSIRLAALINTRNYVEHQINCSINQRNFHKYEGFGFDHYIAQTTIQNSELNQKSFIFSTRSPINQVLELYSWSNIKVEYPQSFDMFGVQSKTFVLKKSNSSESLLKVLNSPADALVYDLSNHTLPQLIEFKREDNNLYIFLPEREKKNTLLITSDINNVREVKPVTFRDLKSQANFLIITHQSLLTSAIEYAKYRQSSIGGNHQTIVVDIQEIYDAFNYGDKSPVAIRNFLKYYFQTTNIKKPYLLLIGRAVSFPDVMKLWDEQNLLPTWGYPGSDNLFSSGLLGFSEDTPAIPTGRINVTTNQQVINYLTKVREYEATEVDLWRKKILHLSGGKSRAELDLFSQTLKNLVPIIEKSFINGEVESLTKQTDEPIVNVDISSQINNGVGMFSFIGHASPTTPDFNIGFASNTQLNFKNQTKYPLMYFNGCGVGNIFYRYETLSTDWLITPNKGAIAILANSFWSYVIPSEKYLQILYKNLFQKKELLGKSIGLIQQATLSEIMANNPDDFDIANAHQIILQGDPSIRIFPLQKPDFQILKNTIKIENVSAAPLNKAEKIRISGMLNNLGIIDSTHQLKVTITLLSKQLKKEININTIVNKTHNNYFEAIIEPLKDIEAIQVEVDKANEFEETIETNNIAALNIDWLVAQQYQSYPQNQADDKINPVLLAYMNNQIPTNINYYSSSPILTFVLTDENPLKIDTTLIEAYLKTPSNNQFIKINNRDITFQLQGNNTLIGTFISPKQIGRYSLLLKGQDLNKNSAGSPIVLNWELKAKLPDLEVTVSPNPTDGRFKFEVISDTQEPIGGKITLSDVLGKIYQTNDIMIQNGKNEYYFDELRLNGMIIYHVEANSKVKRGKIMINSSKLP